MSRTPKCRTRRHFYNRLRNEPKTVRTTHNRRFTPIGVIVGTWLVHLLGLREILAIQIGGESFPIVWCIIGAALLVALLNLLRPRRRG